MKRTLSLMICIVMIMSMLFITPVVTYAAAGDSAENPIYLDAAGLKALEEKTIQGTEAKLKYYELTEYATLTKPINYISYVHFDGKGHTVTLAIDETYTSKLQGIGMFGYAYNTVEIKNLVIAGEVSAEATHSSYSAYGGLIGYVQTGDITVTNVTNTAKIGSTNVVGGNKGSGGIIGMVRSNKTYAVKLTDCHNTGKIISASYAAGLVGYYYDTKATEADLGENPEEFMHIDIINCSNTGALEASECSGAANIRGSGGSYMNNMSINKFFNAGTMTGANLAAIAKTASAGASVLNIENCFNVADLTNATNNNFFVYNYSTKGYIKNSYNAGKIRLAMYGTSIDTLYGENYYVLKGSVTTAVNNYGGLNRSDVIQIEADELDGPTLPTGFSSEVWEYVNGSEYKYPQLKGNTYMEGSAGLPEALETVATAFVCDEGEDISGTYAGEEEITYTGKYIFAFANAADIEGYEKTFGMTIEKDGKVETVNAVPGSDLNGKFGIIFYGYSLTAGEYIITPFATYTLNGESETIYGTQTTATVAE